MQCYGPGQLTSIRDDERNRTSFVSLSFRPRVYLVVILVLLHGAIMVECTLIGMRTAHLQRPSVRSFFFSSVMYV